MKFVLDASAVLALLNDEPGAEAVRNRLDDAAIGAANLVEVATRLIDNGMPVDVARLTVELLELTVVALDEELSFAAAALRAETRSAGLSLADRACLALAAQLGATAVTADRVWSEVRTGCPVELIR